MQQQHDNCYGKMAACHSAVGGGWFGRRLRWICITFMWTERPAAASLLGGWCLQREHTDGCCDWIQIRCLKEPELHGNEGFLRDRSRVEPLLPAVRGVCTVAEQTETPPRRRATDSWGLFPAIRVTSLFNTDILRSCTRFPSYVRLENNNNTLTVSENSKNN